MMVKPLSSSGLVDKILAGCESFSVVLFKRNEGHIPDINPEILSKNRRYLDDIGVSVAAGRFFSDVGNWDPKRILGSLTAYILGRILDSYLVVNDRKQVPERVYFIETPPEYLIDIVTYFSLYSSTQGHAMYKKHF